jgi:DNA replicative helicase MCM subunit Mcm2 (Cdc46/Mcm family)
MFFHGVSGCRVHWQLVREDSSFIDWQRAKVQENSDEVEAHTVLASGHFV